MFIHTPYVSITTYQFQHFFQYNPDLVIQITYLVTTLLKDSINHVHRHPL